MNGTRRGAAIRELILSGGLIGVLTLLLVVLMQKQVEPTDELPLLEAEPIDSALLLEIEPTEDLPLLEIGPFSPAGDFVSGRSEIPQDHFIFIEGITNDDGEGDCGFALIDFPSYSFDGTLEVWGWYFTDEPDPALPLYGFFGHYFNISPTVGLGSGTDNLYPIQELPFKQRVSLSSVTHPLDSEYAHPDPLILVIHSVAENGEVVVEAMGRVAMLLPGGQWDIRYTYRSQSNCVSIETFTLKNHGLLDENQLIIHEE